MSATKDRLLQRNETTTADALNIAVDMLQAVAERYPNMTPIEQRQVRKVAADFLSDLAALGVLR